MATPAEIGAALAGSSFSLLKNLIGVKATVGLYILSVGAGAIYALMTKDKQAATPEEIRDAEAAVKNTVDTKEKAEVNIYKLTDAVKEN